MVESEFLLDVLVCPFTDSSGRDGAGKRREGGIDWQVRYVVFLLSGRSPLTHEPDVFTRHGLDVAIEHAMPVAIRHPDAAGREGDGRADLWCPAAS